MCLPPQPTRSGPAEQALGPDQQDQISTTSAPTYLSSAGTNSVETSTKMPTMKLPTMAPQMVPRPPRVTAAKTSSRILKPIW